jgi:hypothetical protein
MGQMTPAVELSASYLPEAIVVQEDENAPSRGGFDDISVEVSGLDVGATRWRAAGCLFRHFLNYTLRLQPWFLAYGARLQHRAFGASTDRRLPEAYCS